MAQIYDVKHKYAVAMCLLKHNFHMLLGLIHTCADLYLDWLLVVSRVYQRFHLSSKHNTVLHADLL